MLENSRFKITICAMQNARISKAPAITNFLPIDLFFVCCILPPLQAYVNIEHAFKYLTSPLRVAKFLVF